ncbi:unnamed protein product [Leptidea sinapis]|uniref:Uncharacterized protein n=1 Tax=Leptidea sinapis TaxID=189913 RepID=A0A5E4R1W8_9NEOP|nr:unnamed protein product [Leptidea sinapis]
MFGYHTPLPPESPGMSNATGSSKVRTSIGEWESGGIRFLVAKSPVTNRGPTVAPKAPPKKREDSEGRPTASSAATEVTKISTETAVYIYPNRIAEARACLNRAKLNFNNSRNLKTDIKQEVWSAIERLYQLVKEAEHEKPLAEKAAKKGENSKEIFSHLLSTLDKHRNIMIESTEKMCKKVLSNRRSHFVCQGPCGGTFHRGCVKGLAADLKMGRIRLHCNNCINDDGSDNEDTDEENQNLSQILKDIQKKVSSLPQLNKQLEMINESMSVLSEKYDNLLAEHEQSKQKIIKSEKNILSLNNKCVYLEKSNIALEQKVHELDHNPRLNTILRL